MTRWLIVVSNVENCLELVFQTLGSHGLLSRLSRVVPPSPPHSSLLTAEVITAPCLHRQTAQPPVAPTSFLLRRKAPGHDPTLCERRGHAAQRKCLNFLQLSLLLDCNSVV